MNETIPHMPMNDNAADKTPPLKPVVDAVTQEGARLGEKAKELWQQGSESCADAADTVRREAQALGERAQAQVREEPLKSLLVAAAAGAALTGLVLLLGRRR